MSWKYYFINAFLQGYIHPVEQQVWGVDHRAHSLGSKADVQYLWSSGEQCATQIDCWPHSGLQRAGQYEERYKSLEFIDAQLKVCLKTKQTIHSFVLWETCWQELALGRAAIMSYLTKLQTRDRQRQQVPSEHDL